MFQTLSFCFRIGGPPPLIEEILWFGDIGLANLITQSRCVVDKKVFNTKLTLSCATRGASYPEAKT